VKFLCPLSCPWRADGGPTAKKFTAFTEAKNFTKLLRRKRKITETGNSTEQDPSWGSWLSPGCFPAYNGTQSLERPTLKFVVQPDRDFMELTYLSIFPSLALSSKSLISYWSQAYLHNASVERDRHGRRGRLPSVERRPSTAGIPGEGDVAGVGLHQEV
jgi:hypothetical protein